MTWLVWVIVAVCALPVVVSVGLMMSVGVLALTVKQLTPADRRRIARRVARGGREHWGRPHQTLGDFLAPGYYSHVVREPCQEPRVGALTSWWFTDREWEGIPLVCVALDDGVVLEVHVDDPGRLRPGMFIPYLVPAEGGRPGPAVGLAPARIERVLADERARRGLYDAEQHAVVVDGARAVVPVSAPRPTGRVRHGHVEVVVDAVIDAVVDAVVGAVADAGTVRCTGFVRPEEAAGVRLTRRAPVSVRADRSAGVLGPFPW